MNYFRLSYAWNIVDLFDLMQEVLDGKMSSKQFNRKVETMRRHVITHNDTEKDHWDWVFDEAEKLMSR